LVPVLARSGAPIIFRFLLIFILRARKQSERTR
jgi:hypothetical protein